MSENDQRFGEQNVKLTASKRNSSCYPSCKTEQACVPVWGYDNCLLWQCMDYHAQSQVTATEFHTNDSEQRTILIAVLVTGLACIIFCTIGVFVFYKRRRPKSIGYHDDDDVKSFSIEPLTPIEAAVLPPIWTHQCNPFFIGAQSLQIPHLDDTPDPLLKRPPSTINDKPSPITRVGSISSFQCARPTLVRIDTVLKKDDCGLIRKTSIKTVIDPSTSGIIDFYLCPPPQSDQENTPTSSKSTLGDGSITVFFSPS